MAAMVLDKKGYYNPPMETELDYGLPDDEGFKVGDVFSCYIYHRHGEIHDNETMEGVPRHPTECLVFTNEYSILVKSPISLEHARQVAVEARKKHLLENEKDAKDAREYDEEVAKKSRSEVLAAQLNEFWVAVTPEFIRRGLVVRWNQNWIVSGGGPVGSFTVENADSIPMVAVRVDWYGPDDIRIEHRGEVEMTTSTMEAIEVIADHLGFSR